MHGGIKDLIDTVCQVICTYHKLHIANVWSSYIHTYGTLLMLSYSICADFSCLDRIGKLPSVKADLTCQKNIGPGPKF